MLKFLIIYLIIGLVLKAVENSVLLIVRHNATFIKGFEELTYQTTAYNNNLCDTKKFAEFVERRYPGIILYYINKCGITYDDYENDDALRLNVDSCVITEYCSNKAASEFEEVRKNMCSLASLSSIILWPLVVVGELVLGKHIISARKYYEANKSK